MKFLNWMQTKFNKGPGNKKSDSVSTTHHIKQEPCKEEFNDWPHGLLAIGTFGNNELKEIQGSQNVENEQSASEDLAEFTPEEVGKLQKELTKLLTRKPVPKLEGEIADLPLDKFLNCPSSLEVDRRASSSNTFCSDSDNRDEDIDRTIREIIGRCKDVYMESKNKSIGKKSVSFLLKKMFACRSGFAPTPSLRNTLQESRMEKLLRAMISKKMYHQYSSRESTSQKFLEDRQIPKTEKEEKKSNERCKWVKTDSEYIVLEI